MELSDEVMDGLRSAVANISRDRIWASRLGSVFRERAKAVQADPQSFMEWWVLAAIFNVPWGDPWNGDERYAAILQEAAGLAPGELPLEIAKQLGDDLGDPLARALLLDFLYHADAAGGKYKAAQVLIPALFDAAEETIRTTGWSTALEYVTGRACAVARSMSNRQLLDLAWKRLTQLLAMSTEDLPSCRWMLDVAEVVTALVLKDAGRGEQPVIKWLVEALPKASSACEADSQWHLSRESTLTLAALARAIEDAELEKRCLWSVVESHEREAQAALAAEGPTGGPIVAALSVQSAIQAVLELSSRFNDSDVRNKYSQLKAEAVRLHGLASEDLQTTVVEVELGEDVLAQIDRAIASVLAADTPAGRLYQLVKLCAGQIPSIAATEEQTRKDLEGFIYWRLVPTLLIESDRPQRAIGEEDYPLYEAHQTVFRHIVFFVERVFRPALRRLFAEGLLSAGDVVGVFAAHGLLSPGRAPMLNEAIEALVGGRFYSCCHLIVPQFEDSLRKLLAAAGIDVYGQRSGAIDLITLDSLLQSADEVLTEDLVTVFRLVMTKLSMNLRNKLCHGYAVEWEVDEPPTYLALYCLCQLLRWRIEAEPAGDADSNDIADSTAVRGPVADQARMGHTGGTVPRDLTMRTRSMSRSADRSSVRSRWVRSRPFRRVVWLNVFGIVICALVWAIVPAMGQSFWLPLIMGFFAGGLGNLIVSAATEEMNDLGKLRQATSRINRLSTALVNQVQSMRDLEQRIVSGQSVRGLTVVDPTIPDLVSQLEEGLDMVDWELGSMLPQLFQARPQQVQQLIDQTATLTAAQRQQRRAEMVSYIRFAEAAHKAFQEFSQAIRHPDVNLAALDEAVRQLRTDLAGAFADAYPQQFAEVERAAKAPRERLPGAVVDEPPTAVDG